MSPSVPTVYEHDATSSTLQTTLKQELPNSISLVYRTAHHYKTTSHKILATFSPDTPASSIPKCWAVCYLDRSVRPETELWIYASGERHSGPDALCPTCRIAVLGVLDHISTLLLPPMIEANLPQLEVAKEHEKQYPESGPAVRYPLETGSYVRYLLFPSVLTLGAVHEHIAHLCQETGLIREEFPGAGLESELNKFLFKVSALPETRELPEGLRWGKMREQDIPIVVSRTAIPRGKKTLMSLESVGVFEIATDIPVAWTFLGVDGSLTTLHTEPEYRGKGIAKAVAAKIIREYAPELAVDEEGTAWAHADVYVGNSQSEAVCKSLGGKPLWKHHWIRLDIGRAGCLAQAAAAS